MTDKENKILLIAVLFVLVAPYLFTRDWGLISFDNSGQIGDTIGGVTAPIVGLISIYLLYRTLKEQTDYNKQQSIIAHNEQFKSTLFLLLQEQRNIMDKLQAKFYCLKYSNVSIKKNEQASGLLVFEYARQQLNMIFQSLNSSIYYGKYRTEFANDIELQISEETQWSLFLQPNAPEEDRKCVLMDFYNKRQPIRYSYINSIYQISESVFLQYQKHSLDKRIKLGYALFYNQHENIGHYFRHLYQILKFIKESEDMEISMSGTFIKEKKEKEIKKKYRQYAQFIQAQMSINELYLLFYDSFLYPKMQEKLLYYKLLENLTIDNLADSSHNCIEKMGMKKKKDLFEGLLINNK